MTFTVQCEAYIFAGVVQRSIAVMGTEIRGTASEQRGGGWAWFLRYPDGECAGEGGDASWDGVLGGIRDALAMEVRYGRLGYVPREATP